MTTPVSITLFTSSNCSYCPAAKQTLQELADEYGENMFFRTWTVDKDPGAMTVAREWQITSVPTALIVMNGQHIGTIIGAGTKEKMREQIQGAIQSYVFQESSGGSNETGSSVLRDTSESPDIREGSDQNRNRPGCEL